MRTSLGCVFRRGKLGKTEGLHSQFRFVCEVLTIHDNTLVLLILEQDGEVESLGSQFSIQSLDDMIEQER